MVTKKLLLLIHGALQVNNDLQSGKLLIQSNCEDVAVLMRHTAQDVGFRHVNWPSESESLPTSTAVRIPKRTLDWIALGGYRAEGEGWSTGPILPRTGRTETEVACILSGTPVHRSLQVPLV